MPISRRLFSLSLLPLAAISAVKAPARSSIRLRDIEHEFQPDAGNLGRGVHVSKEDADSIDGAGYARYTCGGVEDFPVGIDGSPAALVWRGWVRREGDKHYCAAVEFFPV